MQRTIALQQKIYLVSRSTFLCGNAYSGKRITNGMDSHGDRGNQGIGI